MIGCFQIRLRFTRLWRADDNRNDLSTDVILFLRHLAGKKSHPLCAWSLTQNLYIRNSRDGVKDITQCCSGKFAGLLTKNADLLLFSWYYHSFPGGLHFIPLPQSILSKA